MPVNETVYAGTGNAGVNADTGPSPNLWKNCNFQDLKTNRNKGYAHEEYFQALGYPGSASGAAVTGSCGAYPCYIYQGGSIAAAAIPGGGATFSSDGDNEGAALWSYASPLKLTTSLKNCWFEMSFKVSTIADTTLGVFGGITESYTPTTAVPIATDGTLADKNFVGFHRLEGDGDMLDIVYKADGQTQQTLVADAITLVADTFVKVGFWFNPDADPAKRITFYNNGLEFSTYVTKTLMEAATFPSDITLGFVFGVMNAAGSSPGSATLRWFRWAQQL